MRDLSMAASVEFDSQSRFLSFGFEMGQKGFKNFNSFALSDLCDVKEPMPFRILPMSRGVVSHPQIEEFAQGFDGSWVGHFNAQREDITRRKSVPAGGRPLNANTALPVEQTREVRKLWSASAHNDLLCEDCPCILNSRLFFHGGIKNASGKHTPKYVILKAKLRQKTRTLAWLEALGHVKPSLINWGTPETATLSKQAQAVQLQRLSERGGITRMRQSGLQGIQPAEASRNDWPTASGRG
jgi:hypothetical protein